jgi:hypothetical protein
MKKSIVPSEDFIPFLLSTLVILALVILSGVLIMFNKSERTPTPVSEQLSEQINKPVTDYPCEIPLEKGGCKG